jgi:hypothetical protein
MDDATENWIREVFDMPNKVPGATPTGTPATTQDPNAQASTVPPSNSGGQNGGGTAPGSNGKPQKGAITPGAIKTGNVGKAPAQSS